MDPYNTGTSGPTQPTYSPHPQYGAQQNPYGAGAFEQQKPRGPSCVVIGALVAVVGLIFSGVAVAAIMYISARPDPDSLAGEARSESDWQAQDPERDDATKFERARTAFAGEMVTDHPDFPSVTAFLRELAVVADQTGSPDLKQLVDTDRYIREIKTSDRLQGMLSLRPNSEFKGVVENRILGPVPFDTFQIFKIETPERYEDERIVFVVTNNDDFNNMPQRYWLRKNGNSWLIYDWEPMHYGVRDSHETAILIGGCTDRESDSYQQYLTVSNEFDSVMAGQSDEVYNYARNQKRLRDLMRLPFPPALRSELLLDIAYRWEQLGDLDGENACLKLASNPEKTPGILLELGNNCIEVNDYEQALEYFERYREAIGPTDGYATWAATCYYQLGDVEKELPLRLQLGARSLDPDDQISDLGRVIVDGTEAQIARAFAIMESSDDRDLVFENLIEHFQNAYGITGGLQRVVRHLEVTDPDSIITAKAKTQLAVDSGRMDEAIRPLLQAVESDPRDESSVERLLTIVCDANRLSEYVDRVDPDVGMAELERLYDNDLSDVSLAELNMMAERVLELDVENPKANYYVGIHLADQARYRLAIPFLEKAAADLESDGSDDSGVSTYASRVLARSYAYSGQVDTLVDKYADDEDKLEYVFYYLLENPNADVLEPLVEESEIEFDGRNAAEAYLAFQRGEVEEAEQVIRRIYREANPEDNYSADVEFAQKLIPDICAKTGEVKKSLAMLPSDEMVTAIAEHMIARKDTAGLEKLADAIDALEDENVTIPGFAIRVDKLWLEGKYAEIVDLGVREKIQDVSLDDIYDLNELRYDLIFRAAIRADRLERNKGFLKRIAERVESELGDKQLRLMLAAKTGDERTYSRLVRSHYEAGPFLGDPDVGQGDLAEARRSSYETEIEVIPVSTYEGSHKVMMLLSGDDSRLNPEFLKSAFNENGLGIVDVIPVGNQATNTRTWVARGADFDIAVSIRPRFRSDDEATRTDGVETEVMRAAISHQWQIHIDVRSSVDSIYDPESTSVRAAYALRSDDCLAWTDDYDGLMQPDAVQQIEKLREQFGPQADLPWEQFQNRREVEIRIEDFNRAMAIEFMKKFLPVVEQFRDDPDGVELVVDGAIWRSESRDLIRVKVTSLQLNTYGLPVVTGILQSDSPLHRACDQGMSVQIYTHQIRGFEMKSSGETTAASFIGNDS